MSEISILDEYINEAYKPKYLNQGSDEWEEIRIGRFTSSEWSKLMECGKRPMTPEELKARPKKGVGSKTTQVPDPSKMGDKGITYIYQKVGEILTGKAKQSSYAYPLVYGKETEPQAVEYFENKFNVTCEEVGFQPWGDHAGGSPDRFIGEDQGLEVKCPSESENQIKYLLLNDHYDLKNNYPNHYWQCVTLMLFTGRKIWHFCTYDPRMIEDKHKLTHIVIEWEKVEDDIDLIVKALEAAVKEKLSILQTLRK